MQSTTASKLSGRVAPLDPAATTIDNECYDRFGDGWWQADGPAAGLHEINPIRVEYFDRIFRTELGESAPRTGRFIDIGCGGGILTEAMARRGYRITGFDVSESSLAAARRHAALERVDVTYRTGSAYQLDVATGSVDGVVISDVLEHLHDLGAAGAEIARVLRPGGVLVFDTQNRTVKSYLLMILAAERLLGIIPRRTHDWRMFITPTELDTVLEAHGLAVGELRGMTPALPLHRLVWTAWKHRRLGEFALSDDLSVSYIGYAVRGQP
jgi:2-polyprenyl-6-hydroxyphenyl methylase / 3-demethylubiquinone-9 3-methyltransferase